jgi:hypothetical protein
VQRTKDSGGLTTKEAEQRVAHKMKRAPNPRERKIDQKKLASLRRHKKAKKSVAQLEFELFHRAEYEILYKSP